MTNDLIFHILIYRCVSLHPSLLCTVIYGLIFLFHEPNGNDPLNHDAAEELREDPDAFKRHVADTLRGKSIRVKGKLHGDWT
jgi:hypothetical protein